MNLKRLTALLLLTCAGLLAAPSYPQERLDKTAAYWQHILRLDDWDIYISAISDAKLQGRWAESKHDVDAMGMMIHVLAPAEYAKRQPTWTDIQVEDDITNSILHELVHVRLYGMSLELHELISNIEDEEVRTSTAQLEAKAEEVVVTRLTKALLDLSHTTSEPAPSMTAPTNSVIGYSSPSPSSTLSVCLSWPNVPHSCVNAPQELSDEAHR